MADPVVVLDVETFWSKDFTLRKLPPSRYIRNSQFKLHCASIWLPESEEYPALYWYGDVRKALKRLPWKRLTLLAHHAHFEGLILSHHYGVVPHRYACTLSMARAWHGADTPADLGTLAAYHGHQNKIVDLSKLSKGVERFEPGPMRTLLGDYCKVDVLNTWLVYQDMLRDGFPLPELDQVDRTIRMFADPCLRVDRKLAHQELKRERENKADKIEVAGVPVDDLQSAECFARLLRERGVDPPLKISKTTGEEAYAFAKTDLSFQRLLTHEDQEVRELVEARLAVKSTIGESRAQALLDRSTNGACLPIYINFANAHTLRRSGGDKFNAQNIPASRGKNKHIQLRKCIQAPVGHVLVVVDSSQIELRVTAMLHQDLALLEALRQKRDIYSEFATDFYGFPVRKCPEQETERFVGKTATLSLQYGAGWARFRLALALGTTGPAVFLDQLQARSLVELWRAQRKPIVAGWERFTQLCEVLRCGRTPITYGPVTFDKNLIHMPNGLALHYPEMELGDDGYSYRNGRRRSRIWGGYLTENCLAAGTLVLTRNGWKAIEYITSNDEVYDGDQFVRHGGLLTKSVQKCVSVDGVWMTPDHEVWTDEGWQAGLAQPRPHRPDLWKANSHWSRVVWTQGQVDISLSVRNHCGAQWERRIEDCQGWRDTELRVWRGREATHPRTDESQTVLGVAVDDRSVSSPFAPSLEELRRARDQGLPTLAEVREFLGRLESDVARRADTRTQEEQQGLLARKLHLGDAPRTGAEYSSIARSRSHGNQPADRHRAQHPVLPIETRQVFDIANAGPQQRFVVLGEHGPFIVHNCSQSLACIIVHEQLATLDYRLVGESHDEFWFAVPRRQADRCLEDSIKAFSTPPAWWPGIPLSAEGGWALRYSK